ncbi:MAG: hypothetical protein JWR84_888 [Caulobacter sp.]|nr:hypothetical protein [Caulobacter sp.]
MKGLLVVLLALSMATQATASPAADRRAEQAQERRALDAAVRDLCGRKLVLLGENGFHGDGRTNGFKSDLVQRLVQSCGFDAVFFEASTYDFLEISRQQREGGAVTPEMVSSAIGGLWNQNEETTALIAFLQPRAAAGRVVLGGLDDQLGIRGMFYSLERMPVELAALLSDDRREACAKLLRQRIWSDYPREAPYDEAARLRVTQCLGEIRGAADREADLTRRPELQQILSAMERATARDRLTGPQRLADRDRSMFRTLQWLTGRLPPGSKVIVWSANAHVEKAVGLSGFAPNLGSLVHQAYGNQAFVVGFTAASGSFRWGVRTAHEIPAAPADSLEARALSDGRRDVVYLGPSVLALEGISPGAVVDDHKQVSARWADFYDGVIVFRAERPPRRRDE